MRRAALFAAALALAACDAEPITAEAFADAPRTARAVLHACDRGQRFRDCAAAREGLAEARRRERMKAYAKTMMEPS